MSGKLDWGKDTKQRRARENGHESVDGGWQSPGIGKPIRSTSRNNDKVVVIRHGKQPSPNLITAKARTVTLGGAPGNKRSATVKAVHSFRQPLAKARSKGKSKANLARNTVGDPRRNRKNMAKLYSANVVKISRKPALASPHDLSWEEFREFHNESLTVNQLCDRLMPVVRAYARDGVRRPLAVAGKLNKDRHKTALGHAWTGRLTRFLLTLLFAPPMSSTPKSDDLPKEALEATLTAEKIASRLGHLGRIVTAEK